MSQKVNARYTMVGAYKGQTVTLGRFVIVLGIMETSNYSKEDLVKLDAHLAQWEAYRDGDRRLQENGAPKVQSGGEPSGGEVTSGQETTDSGKPAVPTSSDPDRGLDAPGDRQTEKLKEAIQSLDPKVDSDWTSAGKPAITSVERALGRTGLTRKVIEAALPGFVRPAPVVG